jgi:hypothetical protein
MNQSQRRRLRWAVRGALIFAAMAIFFGEMFTIVITAAEGRVPWSDRAAWAALVISTMLIWGGGGLFFGAILGLYASMIWRDPYV